MEIEAMRPWIPLKKRLMARTTVKRGCWEWQGGKSSQGYGRIFSRDDNETRPAHRMMWEITRRRLAPPGMFVCHKCDNPSCVRPSHLFLGTPGDNIVDKVAKGRQASGERHGMARLNAKKVREIRASTDTQAELARRYGIGDNAISRVINRLTWKLIKDGD